MNSLKFGEFLFKRISETVQQSKYIREVHIDYEMTGSYGNEYIRVDYNVVPNQDFYNLPDVAKQTIFKDKPHYIFTISTHAELGNLTEKRKLLKIMEFKSIYESLAVYVTLQLEQALRPEAIVKIKVIDFWPEANYAEKYLDSAMYLKYKNNRYDSFGDDVRQWHSLHKLANDSKKIYTANKSYFRITDHEIEDLFEIGLRDIRYIILRSEVPIKVKGSKTIETVNIHTLKLVEALKTYIKGEYLWGERSTYQALIAYLYDNFLHLERTEIVERQKADFLVSLIIQKGDILQLKDGRLVIANSVEINAMNAVMVEYLNLKVNLEVGERKRKTSINNISFVLNQKDFMSYKDYTPSRRISLLHKWMLKRKVKIGPVIFEPDFLL